MKQEKKLDNEIERGEKIIVMIIIKTVPSRAAPTAHAQGKKKN